MIRTLCARMLRLDWRALVERALAHLPDLVAEDPLSGDLLMPNNAAAVRKPNAGPASIISLIGSGSLALAWAALSAAL